MSTKYIDIRNLPYAQIIHRIETDLYRIINFRPTDSKNLFWYKSSSLKTEAIRVTDLYLRQHSDDVIIESVEDSVSKGAIQRITKQFKKKLFILSKLQQTFDQIQETDYEVKVNKLERQEETTFTLNELHKISIYTDGTEVAKGVFEESCDDIALTLENKNLTRKEFVPMFLQVLETVRQISKNDYDGVYETTIKTSVIKPNIIGVGDALFECYQNRMRVSAIIKNVHSIDSDKLFEIKISGKLYAIIWIVPQNNLYRIKLIDKHMPVEPDILAPYLL